MRRYHSHFSRREAEIWPLVGQVEPQQKVFADPPISVGGGLFDIHPMRRGGVKSFVDDLVLGRGVVPSRAATSLRSVETQPFDWMICLLLDLTVWVGLSALLSAYNTSSLVSLIFKLTVWNSYYLLRCT